MKTLLEPHFDGYMHKTVAGINSVFFLFYTMILPEELQAMVYNA